MSARHLLLAAALLALAGCHRHEAGRDLDQAENKADGNATDPALTSALADQIMVDPDLASQANPHVSRNGGPVQALVPPTRPSAPSPGSVMHAPAPTQATDGGREGITLGQLAAEQARHQSGRGQPVDSANCERALRYSAMWATKLPDTLPIYPEGAVTEAAGNDAAGCRLRVVSFTTGAAISNVVDFYYTRVRKAGFTAEHQVQGRDHILGGTRAEDGSAYYIIVGPFDDHATEVDIVANNGR